MKRALLIAAGILLMGRMLCSRPPPKRESCETVPEDETDFLSLDRHHRYCTGSQHWINFPQRGFSHSVLYLYSEECWEAIAPSWARGKRDVVVRDASRIAEDKGWDIVWEPGYWCPTEPIGR